MDSGSNSNNKETKSKVKRRRKKDSGKPQSTSTRAGLSFPVPRVKQNILKGKYATKIRKDTPIFLAAVLEYLGVTRILSKPLSVPFV